jgi:hypothetical protein
MWVSRRIRRCLRQSKGGEGARPKSQRTDAKIESHDRGYTTIRGCLHVRHEDRLANLPPDCLRKTGAPQGAVPRRARVWGYALGRGRKPLAACRTLDLVKVDTSHLSG